jgi:flagellar hook-associated protein 3 FlgL
MTTRIGDLSHQTLLSDVMTNTRSRVRDLEMDVAAGKQVRRYAEIPQDTALLLRTREQIATNGNFLSQNERLNDELQAMDGALGSIVSVAERLRTLLVQRLNDPTGDDMPLGVESATLKQEIAAQLNSTSHDRYLFAGTRTDTLPVTLPSAPMTTADPSVYYQGDALNRAGWLDRDMSVDIPVRADDPAFADLFAALGMTQVGHQTNSRTMLENALDKADRALAGVIKLRSTVGGTAARVQGVAEIQRSTALYLDETRGRIEDTDTAAAMTRMSQDKVAIEASYLIVSQISNLSLADYLR